MKGALSLCSSLHEGAKSAFAASKQGPDGKIAVPASAPAAFGSFWSQQQLAGAESHTYSFKRAAGKGWASGLCEARPTRLPGGVHNCAHAHADAGQRCQVLECQEAQDAQGNVLTASQQLSSSAS